MAISEAELLVILSQRLQSCDINENAYIVAHAKLPQGKGKWCFEFDGKIATISAQYEYAKRAACLAFEADDPVKVKLLPKPISSGINPTIHQIPVSKLM
jgi:hypothetical protein